MSFYQFMDKIDSLVEPMEENILKFIFSRISYYWINYTLGFVIVLAIIIWLIVISFDVAKIDRKIKEAEDFVEDESLEEK